MQFKYEWEIIKRNPQFEMDNRNLLDKIDFVNGTLEIDGKHYPMLDNNFPTVDPKIPSS